MRGYVDGWIVLLRDADPAWGFPLVVVGLVLMFMGWQIHKVAVPFTSLLVGLILGQILFNTVVASLIVGSLIGLVLASVTYFNIRYTVGLLGGLVGVFIISGYISTFRSFHLPSIIQWGIALFAFAGGAALAFVMFREMAIIITSFIGSLMLVSGLNGVLPQYIPSLYQTITTFLVDYPAFLVPFLIGGPTLIGTLTQMANADKADVGAM